MTDINTTAGTIEHADPAQVIVEMNVRYVVPLEKECPASIRERGHHPDPCVPRRGGKHHRAGGTASHLGKSRSDCMDDSRGFSRGETLTKRSLSHPRVAWCRQRAPRFDVAHVSPRPSWTGAYPRVSEVPESDLELDLVDGGVCILVSIESAVRHGWRIDVPTTNRPGRDL